MINTGYLTLEFTTELISRIYERTRCTYAATFRLVDHRNVVVVGQSCVDCFQGLGILV
jgi:hypothetical protein